MRLARRKLGQFPQRATDEEDVALSAMASFFEGAQQGRFPQLYDRDNLWSLLVIITARKAAGHIKRELRQKRGGGQVRGEDAMIDATRGAKWDIQQIVGDQPTPEFAAEVAEQCRLLFARLEDDALRRIAQRKLDGHSNEEIAAELQCSLRTVERKLWRIRTLWSEEEAAKGPAD